MTTTVKLQLVDVLRLPLDDRTIIIDVFSLDNSIHSQATVPLNGETDVSIQLQDCPPGVYRFQLSPTNYQVVQFFLILPPGGTVERDKPVMFPVDPAQVIGIAAPTFGNLPGDLKEFLTSARIAADGSIPANGTSIQVGEDLYDALPPKLKAALLNLFLKSINTKLGDGTTCFDHLHLLKELDQDRLFATCDAALLEEVMDSHQFHSVDFSLHKDILGYTRFSSYKTLDREGNLQLTLSRKGTTGNDYLVDMDIDEAQGIAHAFEVIQNVFTGLTNPYNVREILMATQGLRPLYTFELPEQKTASVTVGATA
ncbi:MAG: hypothetical protein WA672_18575 [Candidatus Angelobacter sp.]